MNLLKEYSKYFSLAIMLTLIFSVNTCAEILSGGVRKEITPQSQRKFEIQQQEPNYPTGAILAYNKGIEQYKLSNYDKSIEYFKLAIKQEPKFADAYFNLGILYDYFENPADAIIAFNRAYVINKKDYEALYYVIKCYILLGDNVAARFYTEKIPKDSEYYNKILQLIN